MELVLLALRGREEAFAGVEGGKCGALAAKALFPPVCGATRLEEAEGDTNVSVVDVVVGVSDFRANWGEYVEEAAY